MGKTAAKLAPQKSKQGSRGSSFTSHQAINSRMTKKGKEVRTGAGIKKTQPKKSKRIIVKTVDTFLGSQNKASGQYVEKSFRFLDLPGGMVSIITDNQMLSLHRDSQHCLRLHSRESQASSSRLLPTHGYFAGTHSSRSLANSSFRSYIQGARRDLVAL